MRKQKLENQAHLSNLKNDNKKTNTLITYDANEKYNRHKYYKF